MFYRINSLYAVYLRIAANFSAMHRFVRDSGSGWLNLSPNPMKSGPTASGRGNHTYPNAELNGR